MNCKTVTNETTTNQTITSSQNSKGISNENIFFLFNEQISSIFVICFCPLIESNRNFEHIYYYYQ